MSKICVLTEVQAEAHRSNGKLPDCRGHRHVSRVEAMRHVSEGKAVWASESKRAIVMNPVLDPWRLALRRSGSGPIVVQLIR